MCLCCARVLYVGLILRGFITRGLWVLFIYGMFMCRFLSEMRGLQSVGTVFKPLNFSFCPA
jgi:hypothetical protein